MAAARSLRNQGRADGGGWLEHARLGFNYRIDDIRAAIGLGQLEKLDGSSGRVGRRDALRRAARRSTRVSSSRARTTPTTSGRGSSTSSRCRLAQTARR